MSAKEDTVKHITCSFEKREMKCPKEILRDNLIVDAEAVILLEKLSKKCWTKIPQEYYCHHGEDIALLSPQALYYFLPGYMILIVENFEIVDFLSDNIVSRLTPTAAEGDRIDQEFGELSKLISVDQADSIVLFLRFVRSMWSSLFKSDVDNAIQYWQARAISQKSGKSGDTIHIS